MSHKRFCLVYEAYIGVAAFTAPLWYFRRCMALGRFRRVRHDGLGMGQLASTSITMCLTGFNDDALAFARKHMRFGHGQRRYFQYHEIEFCRQHSVHRLFLCF